MHPTDETIAASGGQDDKSYLWRLDSGEKIYNLGVHTDTVVAIGFNYNGEYVASGGMDGKVFVFRVPDGSLVCSLDAQADIVWLQWHPNGNMLLCGTEDGSAWMWLVPSGECKQVFGGVHVEAVTGGQFTPDGKLVVTASQDGSLVIWDPKTATAIHKFTPKDSRFHQTAITTLAVSPDSSTVLSGGQDGSVRLVSVATGKILTAFDGHSESIEGIGFSTVVPFAATASVEGSVCVWDMNAMKLRLTLRHDDAVTKLVWHQATPHLSTSSMDCTIKTWDARTGECIATSRGHQEGVLDFCVRSDGQYILSGSDDGVALLFEVSARQ